MKFFSRNIFFLVPLFLINCKVVSQQKTDMVKIDNVKVYKDFKIRGYTTAGAYTHFDDMTQERVEFFEMSNMDKEKLEQVLNTAKQKKHFQTKLGINNIFCEVKFVGQYQFSRVVIGLGPDKSIITDLTAMKNYIITNPSDLQRLSTFTEKIKQTK